MRDYTPPNAWHRLTGTDNLGLRCQALLTDMNQRWDMPPAMRLEVVKRRCVTQSRPSGCRELTIVLCRTCYVWALS